MKLGDPAFRSHSATAAGLRQARPECQPIWSAAQSSSGRSGTVQIGRFCIGQRGTGAHSLTGTFSRAPRHLVHSVHRDHLLVCGPLVRREPLARHGAVDPSPGQRLVWATVGQA